MESTTVNSFLDRFIAIVDAGFGLIQGDVSFVLNALIVISIALAGAQWALAQEAPLGPFFRKVLFVGFFAFLINNWNALATAINQSGAALGLRAGGGAMSLPDLHNPGRIAEIGAEMFEKTTRLGEGMNVFAEFIPVMMIFIAGVVVMLAFFVLALQIFVVLVAFKIGSLAAFVALPWGVFNGTSWVAERPLGWVAGSAMRLFVLALIASIAINFVDSLPGTFSLDAGGVLNIILFGLTILGLAWFGPHLASEIVQGQPNLSGAHVVGAAVGATAITYGGVSLVKNTAVGAFRAGAAAVRFANNVRSRGGAGRGGSAGGNAQTTPKIDHSSFQPPSRGSRA